MGSDKPVKFTIYCHTHIESGRRYIGLTSRTMERRWSQHVCQSRRAKGKNAHFANAIRKYGKDAFSHEVLEVHSTLEEANAAEIRLIDEFRTRDPEFGFNLAKGGGYKPDVARRNPWNDPSYRARMLVVMHSPEFVNVHKEACNSQEVVALRREALEREFSDPERKFALVVRMSGKSLSQESRNKIASANRSRVVSQETREKLSQNSAFRTLSPEARARSAQSRSLLPKKTHCKHGHPLSDAYVRANGERICRSCVHDRHIGKRDKMLMASNDNR